MLGPFFNISDYIIYKPNTKRVIKISVAELCLYRLLKMFQPIETFFRQNSTSIFSISLQKSLRF
jgi:hypothetical protein